MGVGALSSATGETVRVLVRPRRSMLVTGFVSIALGMIPLFGVLYWFGAEHGNWVPVLVVHLMATAAAVLVLIRQLTVYSAVTATELVGRGIFSPLVRVPLAAITSVDLVETYVGQAPDSATQLLVRDAEGRRLFRMRGNFYQDGDLQRIAEALPVAARVSPEPIPLPEFFRAYPGSAYWFEGRPIVRVALFAGALLAALGMAAWVMSIVGTPLGSGG